MRKTVLLLSIALSAGLQLSASQAATLTSPNQLLEFQFQLLNGIPAYSILYKGTTLIKDATLDLEFAGGGSFSKGLWITKIKLVPVQENYSLIVGKTMKVQDQGNEMSIVLSGKHKDIRQVILRIRAYDDGIAFRYEFPKAKNAKSYELVEEKTTFRFVEPPYVSTLLLPHYKTSHEGLYTHTNMDSIPGERLMDMPTLLHFPGKCYMAITEAALRNYAGMYLQKTDNRTLISRLSPLPGQTRLKVRADLPHHTPWRVIMIAAEAGKLIESNLLTHLNEPSSTKDWTWLKPGKSTWTWWHGDIIKNVDFEVGQNFETHQYYIDWCAANNIEYHAIIEHGNLAWYKGDGEGFDPPPPHADVTKPVETLPMEKLAAYSRQKGVGLRLWVHWKPLSEKLEEAFALYEKWNVKGLMVDFMDRDDQEMVLWQEEVLKTAAKYHLHVQFHGAYKPTGLHRTYPNELTREAALNLEGLKWASECDPEHNLIIPFTRMLAGPTDYHSGGFRSSIRENFKPQFHEPTVLGTRCHHMALYVVFESYLHLVSDYPQAYDNQPGFEFIRSVPTTWDETRVLAGQPGDYIVIARRKGKDWFIGAMNDWTDRDLEVPLDFLASGTWQTTMYEDAANGNPDHLIKSSKLVNPSEPITIKMASGGGAALHLSPMEH